VQREYIEILKNGGVGVIPTDTIYGIVGRALDPDAVARVVRIKNRSDGKSFIVLISSTDDLKTFGIPLPPVELDILNKVWPGKVSVAFDDKRAFRLPDDKQLIEIIKQTGPLIAPSANPEGQPPATDIAEAKAYFGDRVDFYEDGGKLQSPPSTLIKIKDGKIEVLREGAVKIK
jgi:L-threonylcarbamoyladenylate synthase